MKKILVVDDEEFILETWIDFFKDTQPCLEVHSASNPLQALQLIEIINYDLIISDYKMPNMNGLDLIEKIRLHSNHADTPVFLFSSFLPEETKRIERLSPVIEMNKPMEFENMKLALEKYAQIRID